MVSPPEIKILVPKDLLLTKQERAKFCCHLHQPADSSMHACGGAGQWKVLLLMTGRYNLGLRRRWQSSHHKFHLLLVSCRHAPPLSTLTSHVTGQLTINCCLQASAELQMISLVYASAYVDNIDLCSFSPQPKLDWMIISPLESNHCSCVQSISPPLHCITLPVPLTVPLIAQCFCSCHMQP